MLTKEFTQQVEKIILEAGSRVLKGFNKKKIVKKKEGNELYTQLDLSTEKYLIKNFKKLLPNCNFISEETNNKKEIDNKNFTWIIDPIDGTNNFIKSNPHFCISVSLKKNNQSQLGIIYDPIRKELFRAIYKKGIFLNNKKVSASNTKLLKDAIVSLGFVKSFPKIMKHVKKYHKVYPYVKSLRNSGSAALDLAYLASGRVDACWLIGLKQWDYDAGLLMINESNLKVFNSSKDKNHNFSESLIASNKNIYNNFINLIL